MSISSLLRNWIRSNAGERVRTQAAHRKRATFRPWLEALEGRDLPSTLTVTNLFDPAGSSPGSLRTEIDLAQNGDTIVFDPSLAGQTIRLNYKELLINKDLTIQGLPNNPVISAGPVPAPDFEPRVFEVAANAHVNMIDLTIINGNGASFGTGSANTAWGGNLHDGLGGGILNLGTLNVSNCTLSGNVTAFNRFDRGGAIYNAGTLTVSGCTFSGNRADGSGHEGTGGAIDNIGTMTVSGSTFVRNRASTHGGAICNVLYTDSSNLFGAGNLTATVSGCTFSGNIAYLGGGGIWNGNFGQLTVSGCTFTGNQSPTASTTNNGPNAGGGAIWNGATMTVTQSTLSGNSDVTKGGGIFIASGAKTYLDSFTVAHTIGNKDRLGLNSLTANIDGTYNLLP